jgi:hypothetical protein
LYTESALLLAPLIALMFTHAPNVLGIVCENAGVPEKFVPFHVQVNDDGQSPDEA